MPIRKLQLVPKGRPVSSHRITVGNLYADILVDRRVSPEIWLYVVQREGSPEVLAMGSCASEDEAKKVAQDALSQFRADAASSAAS
jgi:hypothetical protein